MILDTRRACLQEYVYNTFRRAARPRQTQWRALRGAVPRLWSSCERHNHLGEGTVDVILGVVDPIGEAGSDMASRRSNTRLGDPSASRSTVSAPRPLDAVIQPPHKE